MWSYIFRRLSIMIPTLIGVTIVSFGIMQLAPGDPAKGQASMQGTATTSVREAYLTRKRELNLDKPIMLNFRWFKDYDQLMRSASYFFSLDLAGIATELEKLAPVAKDEQNASQEQRERLRFLRALDIYRFDERLQEPDQRSALTETIPMHVQIFCEDAGIQAVPALMKLLESPETPTKIKIGALRCLPHMVPDPFVYTYSRNPSDAETPQVVSTWSIWWDRSKGKYEPIPAERLAELKQYFSPLVAETKNSVLMEAMDNFFESDVPFFAETLLGNSTLREKVISSLALLNFVGKPLKSDVPLNADASQVNDVSQNWLAFYRLHQATFEPSAAKKAWYFFSDTQYAHMATRLVTFDFGKSATKTREPVGPRIWEAVKVSAPLMVMAEVVIYFFAVTLGVLCAVNHGGWIDRLISLKLFLLYSVPPYVAGMLFLLFFCYGDYLKWFPMLGLHSEGAEALAFGPWLLNYLWHAFLPVVCLSLFSLAGMAMYARTSMLDVLGQDYIRTARAKGVPEPKVIGKHALRNALIPIVTLFADFLPAMLGGSVLIEYLFGIPGMGRLSWASIEQKDYYTLMALIYIQAIVVMLSILLSDLLYVIVDPRISLGGQGDRG